jgi:cleavage and polyadenylation specificity factor subunit 1
MNLDLVTRTYPIITQVERLPYDCLYLLACPTSYGGVVVVSSNAIFHIDQAAKVVGSPANGWASRVSDISFGPRDTSHGAHTKLSLEGSHLAYVDERTLLLFLADGAVYPITVVVDGKTVSRLVIGEPLAQTSPAAVLCSVQEQMLFVGSTSGSSLLFKHERFIPAPTNASSNGAYAQEEPKHSEESEGEMDLDDGKSFAACKHTRG